MVPEQHLSRVAGLNQTLQGLTDIVTPPLAAVLLGIQPMQSVLAVDVVTAILAVAPLCVITIPRPGRSVAPDPSVLADLRAGLRFVWGWPGLMMVIVIATLSNLLTNPAFAIAPLLVSAHFGGDALELGWFQSAFGIGLVVGGLTLGIWGGLKRRVVTMYLAQALGGICILVVGLASANGLPLAVGAVFLVGFLSSIHNGSLLSVVQATVSPEIQGRVLTLMMSGSGVTIPLGLAIAGPVADALGVRPWFVIAGLVTAGMGVGAFLVPAILRIEDHAAKEMAPGSER
jgi:DHA3 family macrolide efflux protein-like MFS transporter